MEEKEKKSNDKIEETERETLEKVSEVDYSKYLEGYEKKFIIYEDDDGSIKEKVAWVRPENSGWWVKLAPMLKAFWIGSNRVRKVKPTSDDKIEREKLSEENFKEGGASKL